MTLSPSTLKVIRQSGALATAAHLLEVASLRKEFPGVVALDDVALRLRPGTVHALVGGKGAGKSTLMKVLGGVHPPDAGFVRLKGVPITIRTPGQALDAGIAMIHRDPALMPLMTVADNVWIGREPLTPWGFLDHRELDRRTAALFAKLDIAVRPRAEVRDLSLPDRRMVEVAKAVSCDPDILLMDEPTSALGDGDAGRLLAIIETMRREGKGILYVGRRMNEVLALADDVSVFRDGRRIATRPASDVDRDTLIEMMAGRAVAPNVTAAGPIGD